MTRAGRKGADRQDGVKVGVKREGRGLAAGRRRGAIRKKTRDKRTSDRGKRCF